jgi:hypothetical protein
VTAANAHTASNAMKVVSKEIERDGVHDRKELNDDEEAT